ncbi:MAG: hypothetical protein P8K27_06855 [Gammaproteobacteria bacterium]|nr:hypothetical protein [Gammaproteobacteria bacterium]
MFQLIPGSENSASQPLGRALRAREQEGGQLIERINRQNFDIYFGCGVNFLAISRQIYTEYLEIQRTNTDHISSVLGLTLKEVCGNTMLAKA